ncbi:uncharacterized protein PV06_07352 [Exophiala oligosperma]|uniref:GPI anchored protein n=2 Tax=Chaetothyriales TaxID=34395 RepID=A0A0D2DXA6_9EURO|nr:uncharacterized protein PV06_07352 [Exophiala oligosperma]KAJ9639095.1 hypothetical protein H2204_004003 [Knufia peltigerae]KIW40124.1 hypothetical protein PV06_07352 [Exophiala oligosperma]
MVAIKTTGLALTLAGAAAAQSSSVVSVFFPGLDSQTLLGSVIKSDSSKTTMAVACPSGTDSNDCGIVGAITVTVGASTFHAQESFESTSVIIDCKVSGTTAADCAETYVGPAGLIATDAPSLTNTDASFDTSITSTVTSTTLGPTDMSYVPVTLTDSLGDGSGSSTTASTGASGSSSTASATSGGASSSSSSKTSGSSGTSSGSGSATPTADNNNGASGGDSRMLAWSAMGAGLVGMMIMLL